MIDGMMEYVSSNDEFEKGKVVGHLMADQQLKRELMRQGAKWSTRSTIAPEADVLFLKNQGLIKREAQELVIRSGSELTEAEAAKRVSKVAEVNVHLAGVEALNCVAVVFYDNRDEADARVYEIWQKLVESGEWRDGDQILSLNIRDVQDWLEFREREEEVVVEEEEEDFSKEEETDEEIEAGVSLREEVIEELFGEEGLLKHVGYIDGKIVSPGNQLDLVFVNSDGKVQKLNIYGGGHGEVTSAEDIKPIGNVVGIVIFEDDAEGAAPNQRERKSTVRKAQASVRGWVNDPEVQVVGVTRQTLEIWRNKGRAEATEEDVKNFLETASKTVLVDHGFYVPTGPMTEASLRLFEPFGSEIGGTQMFLEVKRGGLRHTVILDMGWPFGRSEHYSSIIGRPSYKTGIIPYLRAKTIPMVSRLYRQDILEKAMKPELFNEKDPYAMFVLGELYHRLGVEELKDLTQRVLPHFARNISWSKWNRKLSEHAKQVYDEKVLYHGMLISHAHQDHATCGSFVRYEVPAGMSLWTRLLLELDYTAGWHWTVQEVIRRKKREEAMIKNTYPVEERPVLLFDDGQMRDLGGGFKATGFDVYHSLPGAMGYLVEIDDGLGNVVASLAYPGDYRFDPHFFEEVGRRGVHTLFVEGTNPPGVRKTSARLTEEVVIENIGKEIRKADTMGALMMVRLVKGNVERLSNLIDEAGGRTVLISRKVARLLHMAGIQEAAIGNGNGNGHGGEEESRLNAPSLRNERLKIYQGNKDRYDPWERELMATYGSVDDDEISSDPKNFLLILDHRDQIADLGMGGNSMKVRFLDSVYWPYSKDAKDEIKQVMRECQARGWEYLADVGWGRGGIVFPSNFGGFHASGHIANFDDQIDLIRMANPMRIVIGHTQHRGNVADALREALPGIEVVSRMNHGWSKVDF